MDTQENYIVKGEQNEQNEQLTDILDKYGVVIIPNILTPEECEEGIDEILFYQGWLVTNLSLLHYDFYINHSNLFFWD
jgi:hypothetical protein